MFGFFRREVSSTIRLAVANDGLVLIKITGAGRHIGIDAADARIMVKWLARYIAWRELGGGWKR